MSLFRSLPRFDATSASIVDDTQRLVDQARSTQDAIVRRVSFEDATFDNVILPLVHDENERLHEQQMLEFYQHVSIQSEIRAASREAQHTLAVSQMEMFMRKDLYSLVSAASKRASPTDRESQRIIQQLLWDFHRNGMHLPDQASLRLREIRGEVEQIQTKFLKHLADGDQKGIWLSKSDLQGLPDQYISQPERGDSTNKGKVFLKFVDCRQALANIEDGSTRKRIYLANANKCTENLELLHKAVVLRDEAARLLGWSDAIDFALSARMERSKQKIFQFLHDLKEALAPSREQFVSRWKQIKAVEEPSSPGLFLWDVSRYSTLMMERDFAVHADTIARYFPLEQTIDRMLKLFERLFQMSFVEVTAEERLEHQDYKGSDIFVWCDDVRLFCVWDTTNQAEEENKLLGYLYTDMYSRPGKNPGLIDLPIHPGYIKVNGARSRAATALLCNFGRSSRESLDFLKHGEVVILFHELGHGIHDLVAKTRYARFHGASCSSDFNETPSQFLENWCWTESALSELNQDPITGEKLSTEMVDTLLRTKRARSVMTAATMLDLALFEMNIYSSVTHHDTLDSSATWKDIMQRNTGLDITQDISHYHTTLPQMIQNSAPSMYSYLSSQLYSYDLFLTAFAEDPMNAEQGLRYRHTIIGKGSSQDEMEMLVNFLGREPRPDAFYKALGIEISETTTLMKSVA